MVSSCIDGRFVSQDVSLDSVAGAVQLFRRECFEDIGGYLALPMGGIDAAAEIMARQCGWKVRTFPDFRVLEHRRTGTATANPLVARIREGRRLHSLGYGFMFFLMRCVRRSMEQPRVVGSLAALYGYLWRCQARPDCLAGECRGLPPAGAAWQAAPRVEAGCRDTQVMTCVASREYSIDRAEPLTARSCRE